MDSLSLVDRTPSSESSMNDTLRRSQPSRPLVIGLVGGIASGKSTVAEILRNLGAAVLDADRAGHEALRLPHVATAIRNRWGEAVFNAAGEVDRAATGRIVFSQAPDAAEELRFLEALTHPEIGRLLGEQMRQAIADGKPAVVLDAPVMSKAGWDNFCDKIIFVDAPRAVRLARAQLRGWSEEEFDRREAAQEALDAKRSRADMIIDNSTSTSATEHQTQHFWHATVG